MYQRIFPTYGWPEKPKKKSENDWIKWAPVGIDGRMPVAVPKSIANVQIGNAVRVHRRAACPG